VAGGASYGVQVVGIRHGLVPRLMGNLRGRLYQLSGPNHVFRWWRLAAWAMLSLPPALLVSPWLAPAGVAAFEAFMLTVNAVGRRRLRASPSGGGWTPRSDPDAGVREPRRRHRWPAREPWRFPRPVTRARAA
jgi:hypothetical protein